MYMYMYVCVSCICSLNYIRIQYTNINIQYIIES